MAADMTRFVKIDLFYGTLDLDAVREQHRRRGSIRGTFNASNEDQRIKVQVWAIRSLRSRFKVLDVEAHSWEEGGWPKLSLQGLLAQEWTTTSIFVWSGNTS